MLDNLFDAFSRGLLRIRDNHQLIYTIIVAVIIFSSFFYVVNRFIVIAEDAQEQLINVRVGSIQDAFVVFAVDDLNNPGVLRANMEAIQASNKTIEEFKVLKFVDGTPLLAASLGEDEAEFTEQSFILKLALLDSTQSFTTFIEESGVRFTETARAITNRDGEVVGLVYTKQSLSEADQQIEHAIQTSLIAFVIIVFVLVILFFRYARIIDYATLYRKLSEIDGLKDDFIAMASHEFRSPLTTIRGYLELISTDTQGLSKEQKKYAKRIDSSAVELNDLVNDMLDVSRIEQGRMKYEYTDFNIEELISEVVDDFKQPAKKKGLSIVKEGLKEIVIHSDRNKIHRVLVNLVSNAVKYTNEGEVKISFDGAGDYIDIRISDTGIGISREDQEKLFEKFHRIRSKETEDVVGTGLGLWLTRAIIRELGGDISIESIQKVGTHFVVKLPITRK